VIYHKVGTFTIGIIVPFETEIQVGTVFKREKGVNGFDFDFATDTFLDLKVGWSKDIQFLGPFLSHSQGDSLGILL
jgi:hypothetical protein